MYSFELCVPPAFVGQKPWPILRVPAAGIFILKIYGRMTKGLAIHSTENGTKRITDSPCLIKQDSTDNLWQF